MNPASPQVAAATPPMIANRALAIRVVTRSRSRAARALRDSRSCDDPGSMLMRSRCMSCRRRWQELAGRLLSPGAGTTGRAPHAPSVRHTLSRGLQRESACGLALGLLGALVGAARRPGSARPVRLAAAGPVLPRAHGDPALVAVEMPVTGGSVGLVGPRSRPTAPPCSSSARQTLTPVRCIGRGAWPAIRPPESRSPAHRSTGP